MSAALITAEHPLRVRDNVVNVFVGVCIFLETWIEEMKMECTRSNP
jgi:hypothetical protein